MYNIRKLEKLLVKSKLDELEEILFEINRLNSHCKTILIDVKNYLEKEETKES